MIKNDSNNDTHFLGDLIACRDLNRFLDTPESINYAIRLGIRILSNLTRQPKSYYKSLRIQEGDLLQELLLQYQEMTCEFHPKKRIILFVDDDHDFLNIVKKILEQAGFIVWSASTGKLALEFVYQRPDLILLDMFSVF